MMFAFGAQLIVGSVVATCMMSVCTAQSPEGQIPAALDLFVDGNITPHSESYEGFAWQDFVDPQMLQAVPHSEDAPEWMHWRKWATITSHAYIRAAHEDKSHVKRAVELLMIAYWVLETSTPGIEDHWREGPAATNLPTHLELVDLEDLLTLRESFRARERYLGEGTQGDLQ